MHASNVVVTVCTQLPPITDIMNNGIPGCDALDYTLAHRTEIRPSVGWERLPGHPRKVWV